MSHLFINLLIGNRQCLLFISFHWVMNLQAWTGIISLSGSSLSVVYVPGWSGPSVWAVSCLLSHSDRPQGQLNLSSDLWDAQTDVSCVHQRLLQFPIWIYKLLRLSCCHQHVPGFFFCCGFFCQRFLPWPSSVEGIKDRCWWRCSAGWRTFLLLSLVTGMLNEAIVVDRQDKVSVVVPFFDSLA